MNQEPLSYLNFEISLNKNFSLGNEKFDVRFLEEVDQVEQTADDQTQNSINTLKEKEWEWITNVAMLSIFGSVSFLVLIFLLFYFIRRVIRKRKQKLRMARRIKELKTHKKKHMFRVKHVLSGMKN